MADSHDLPSRPIVPLPEAQLRDLLAVYAIDAVDAAEADAVERFLLVDPRAAAEVQQYRETAAMLAFVGADAPVGLWDKISSQLDEDAPTLDVASLVSQPRSVTAAVTPIESRRRRTDRWFSGLAAAACALIAGLGLAVVQLRTDLSDTRTDLAATNKMMTDETEQQRLERAAASAMTSPQGMLVRLEPTESLPGTTGAESSVEAVMMPEGDCYVMKADLPALDASETYQLWGKLVDGRVVGLAVLGQSFSTSAFRVDDVAQLEALVVTRERAGGVARAEGPVIVAGPVTA
jgi:hypothetical protein